MSSAVLVSALLVLLVLLVLLLAAEGRARVRGRTPKRPCGGGDRRSGGYAHK